MQEGFVDSHGALIYYMVVGHGAPLMIVHGGPGASHEYLLPYLLPLMRTSRLIFIDERGSGDRQIGNSKQYTIAKWSRTSRRFVRALAPKRARR